MSQLTLFSSGMELANLVVSSGLLQLSWAKILELYNYTGLNQNEEIRWEVYHQQQPKCIIIAFVVSPNCTKQLLEERELIPSSSLHFFHFLCTQPNSFFCIHKAAVTLYASVHDQLSRLKTQLDNSIPIIVTGHCLGGSVASLFTLWLLESFNQPGTKRPLCITFGAPPIGDKGLEQAISQHLMWDSSFLHVVANQDLVLRLFILFHNPNARDNAQTGGYKPFGTFLLCSESGCTCLEGTEAVSEVLVAMGLELAGNQNPNEQWHMVNYENIVKHLMSIASLKGISQLRELIVCPLQAGIVLQLETIGLDRRQRNGDINLMIAKMEKWEKDCAKRKMTIDPSKKLNDMKVYMAYLEWYKKDSKSENKGYYDSYKNKGLLKKDMEVVKFKKYLTNYWQQKVAEAERMPQKEGEAFRTIRWLYAGTNYRRMVEPLDIADYYKDKGLKDYKTNGRSRHYKMLEQWLEEEGKPSSSGVNTKKQNVSAGLTEDSCFWAHVEEALIQCKLLRNGEEGELTRKNLIKFEEYVMEQIKNYAVSPEIFLGGSSFMQWWKEYEQIIGTSYESQLTDLMKNGRYHQYECGSLVLS